MSQNVIDIEGLKRLSGDDDVFVSEILKLYTERAEKDIEELKAARGMKDWSTVRFVVHRMRSAAVPLGLKDLVVLLKKVELNLKENIVEGVESQLDEIFSITERAIDDAKQKLVVITS